MLKKERIGRVGDLDFKIKYSARRTIGISVLPDSSVVVRVPFLTSMNTINRIVGEKYDWVVKHRDTYRMPGNRILKKLFVKGEIHLFRGKEYTLRITESVRSFVRFSDNFIEVGTDNPGDPSKIKRLIYQLYKIEAESHFPLMLNRVLIEHECQMFRPAGLVIRTMKRRWGSCSSKGVITLSTELIRLSDVFTEYVILHELCHLKHHNHSSRFYELLSVVFPEWKSVRKEMRKYIQ